RCFLSWVLAASESFSLSLHDALPIFTVEPALSIVTGSAGTRFSLDITSHLQTLVNKSGWTETSALKFLHTRSAGTARRAVSHLRSEEHTSELQSRENLVCRLLLEKTQ